jgi:hypothetical protein
MASEAGHGVFNNKPPPLNHMARRDSHHTVNRRSSRGRYDFIDVWNDISEYGYRSCGTSRLKVGAIEMRRRGVQSNASCSTKDLAYAKVWVLAFEVYRARRRVERDMCEEVGEGMEGIESAAGTKTRTPDN